MFSRLANKLSIDQTQNKLVFVSNLKLLSIHKGEDLCALHSLLLMQMLMMPLIKALMKEF
jgi:hypothetical protein